MKKFSSLLVLALVIFNLTFTISFPFVTVSENENTNTETTTVYGEPYSSPSPAYTFEKNEDGSKKLYVVTNNDSDLNKAVFANLGYTRVSTEDYDSDYFNFVKVESSDANYSENFNLYYKLELSSDSLANYISNSNLFS